MKRRQVEALAYGVCIAVTQAATPGATAQQQTETCRSALAGAWPAAFSDQGIQGRTAILREVVDLVGGIAPSDIVESPHPSRPSSTVVDSVVRGLQLLTNRHPVEQIAQALVDAFVSTSVLTAYQKQVVKWAYIDGSFPLGPVARLLGDVSQPLSDRLRAMTVLRSSPPDSLGVVAANRAFCQLAGWSAAFDAPPRDRDIMSALTREGLVLADDIARWLSTTGSATNWVCTTWEECFGRGNPLALWATEKYGALIGRRE